MTLAILVSCVALIIAGSSLWMNYHAHRDAWKMSERLDSLSRQCDALEWSAAELVGDVAEIEQTLEEFMELDEGELDGMEPDDE